MLHTFFFQYNIPAENQANGRTDEYINVISLWHTDNYFSDGKPMFSSSPVNLSFYDVIKVKDWNAATRDIDSIAEKHFMQIARNEKLAQARAVLAMNENPILERMELKLTEPLY